LPGASIVRFHGFCCAFLDPRLADSFPRER
jgi:hypothetical protein